MASAAAQRYFAQQSPQDQQAILASWGGQDLTDQWFKNAQAAGSAPAAGAPAPAAGSPPPGLMDFNQWFAEGNKEKGDWKDNAQSRQAYQAYVYNASNPGQTGSAEDAQGRGGYGQSGDPSGMRAYARANGLSEDFNQFDNATLFSWEAQKSSGCPANAPYQAYDGSGCVEKPIDSAGRAGGEGGGGGQDKGGGGSYGGATTGFGGAPAFQYDSFKPPLPGDTTTDPSYLFRVKEGQDALERSASARGVLRTSGTLKDILDYGQNAASQEYGNIYNRGLSTWGAQYQGQKDAFAPQYGSWSTVYGGDLSKYLQKENNIYGLLNQPAPVPPYYG